MKKARQKNAYVTIGALCIGLTLPLSAATIFDNSVNDLVYRFDPGTYEVGDEILLAGSDRMLTMFSFEYWGTNTLGLGSFSGSVEARVQFYNNDGTPFHGYATPGTSFYDSGWFSVPGLTPRSTFVFSEGSDFPSGGLLLPVISNMTWSVTFTNLGAGDQVGVDIYSPPVAGGDYPDYWQNNGGWSLLTNTVPMNFAAKMETPEPTMAALTILGGFAALAASRKLRRKQ
jgi:hypothetical protein